jgi:hypothetical protein
VQDALLLASPVRKNSAFEHHGLHLSSLKHLVVMLGSCIYLLKLDLFGTQWDEWTVLTLGMIIS